MNMISNSSDTLRFLSGIQISSASVARCHRYRGLSANHTLHSHDTLELDFFLKGHHEINVNSRTMESGAFDLVGYAPGCPHQGRILQEDTHDIIVLWLNIKCVTPFPNGSFRLRDENGVLRWLFEQCWLEYGKRRCCSAELTDTYCRAILFHLLRAYQTPSPASLEDRMDHVLLYLNENYSLPVTVEQLASMTGVSVTYFHRLFRRHTGMTPLQYLQQIRISAAQNYLTSTDLSVQEVSRLVGIEDPRYFTRIFTRSAGSPPSSWRKQN